MYYWSHIKQKATIHQSFFRNSISFHPPSVVTLSTLDHRPFHEKSEAMTTSCIELLWSHPKAPRWPMDGSFPRFCCMWNDGFLNGKEKSWMKGACLKMKTISLLMGLSKNISWRFLLERLPPTCHGEERSGLVAPPFWMLSKEKNASGIKHQFSNWLSNFWKESTVVSWLIMLYSIYGISKSYNMGFLDGTPKAWTNWQNFPVKTQLLQGSQTVQLLSSPCEAEGWMFVKNPGSCRWWVI